MKRLTLLLLAVLLLAGASFAKFVAVLETVGDGKDGLSLSERQYLTNMLREQAVRELPAELNFTIMTRENIMMMLPPGKSIEDCEGSCLAETGKNIAADYVAQARVGKVGDNLSISAELYETAGNKLVASFNGLGANVNALIEVINLKAPEFFRKARGGSTGVIRTEFDNVQNQAFVVNVSTNPAGAALSIDGRPVPKCSATPCQVMVDAGDHRFVAVLEHYEDAEGQFNVNANGQQISLDMVPRYGTLKLDLEFPLGGKYEELQVKVDGKDVPAAESVIMDPGTHDVTIAHRCYSPVTFKVGISRDKEETFKESLKPAMGGLSLKAHSKSGEELKLPVYVGSEKKGFTPFTGSVPVCAPLSVGAVAGKNPVEVNLVPGEVTEFDYVKSDADASAVAGESIPSNVEQPEKSSHIALKITFGAVSLLGFGAAIFSELKQKALFDQEPENQDEYKKNLEDIDNFEPIRRVGLLVGGLGLVALGVTFFF